MRRTKYALCLIITMQSVTLHAMNHNQQYIYDDRQDWRKLRNVGLQLAGVFSACAATASYDKRNEHVPLMQCMFCAGSLCMLACAAFAQCEIRSWNLGRTQAP
jgi:hypothetical protein